MNIRQPVGFSSFESLNRSVPLFDRFVAWVCHKDRAGGLFVTEQELTGVLEISRTPMREVLHQAQMIGLIRREPNRSIEIPPLTRHDMEQLSITRGNLESLIAATVAERVAAGIVSIEPLEKINRRIRALADLGDMELQLEAGLEFHAQMRLLSGNAVAARLLDQLMIRLERYRQLVTEEPRRGGEIVEEHARMLEAIGSGNAARAAEAASTHIARARELYHQILNDHLAPD